MVGDDMRCRRAVIVPSCSWRRGVVELRCSVGMV
jgi:hypothetical protein